MQRKIALLFGLFVILSPYSAIAQYNSRGFNRAAQPSRMRHAQTATSRQNVEDSESGIVGRIQAMEREMEQAGRWLEQQLARAGQVRQRGLRTNDQNVLKQAEKMEQQSLYRYEKWINQFDQFSTQMDRSTKARAQSRIQAHERAQERARAQTQSSSQSTLTPSTTQANRQPRNTRQRRAVRQYRHSRWPGVYRRK